jgi:hypothetical protein
MTGLAYLPTSFALLVGPGSVGSRVVSECQGQNEEEGGDRSAFKSQLCCDFGQIL